MKIIIDNQSSMPDTIALLTVKDMMMLPRWPKVQMERPKGYCFYPLKWKLKVKLTPSRLSVLRLVVDDFPETEDKKARGQG
jgi:hypothetical protein